MYLLSASNYLMTGVHQSILPYLTLPQRLIYQLKKLSWKLPNSYLKHLTLLNFNLRLLTMKISIQTNYVLSCYLLFYLSCLNVVLLIDVSLVIFSCACVTLLSALVIVYFKYIWHLCIQCKCMCACQMQLKGTYLCHGTYHIDIFILTILWYVQSTYHII